MAVPSIAAAENAVAIAPDPITDALGCALDVWSSERDVRGLRRALIAVLSKLDELP